MSSAIKSLARHSGIYTISTFVQRALGFILLPIYTDTTYISSRSGYGDMSLVYTFIAFMNVIYLYGLDLAMIRYFFTGRFSREDVYKTSFITTLVNSALLSALICIFAEPISGILLGDGGYSHFIRITAGILLFDGLGSLPYNLLRAEEKSVVYSVLRVGRFLLELLLNLFFVMYLRQGILGILYANLIASVINFAALYPFQHKYLKGAFRRDAFVELMGFGLPMLPNGVAYLVTEVSDRFVMRILLDKDALGVYSANRKFGSILLMIVMAFKTAWQPFLMKVSGAADAKQIYSKVMTWFTLAGVLLIISATFLVDGLLRIPLPGGKYPLGPDYWEGISLIPIILCGYLFYGFYANFTVGVFIQKKSRYMIVFTGLAAAVNLAGNLILMPLWGIMGAAVSAMLAYLVMAASLLIANQIIYPVPYNFRRIGFLLLYLTVMLAIYYAWELSSYQRFGILIASFILLRPLGLIKGSEVKAIISGIRKLVKRDSNTKVSESPKN
jgi:O-antigen/teichoic acid export membrane protein